MFPDLYVFLQKSDLKAIWVLVNLINVDVIGSNNFTNKKYQH